jgi:hypothetical protein
MAAAAGAVGAGLHLAVDPDSGETPTSDLTDQDVDDPSRVGALLDQVAGDIASVTAAGALMNHTCGSRDGRHVTAMKTMKTLKTRRRKKTVPLPLMMAELAFSSWETIARRSWMMAQGTCSAAEYRRMVLEKAEAAQLSGKALGFPRGKSSATAVLAPWHRRAVANSKRLRKKTQLR